MALIVTSDDVSVWCEQLLSPPQSALSLEQCLGEVPALETLQGLNPGTRVLVRCDTNVMVSENGSVENDARLASLLETLQFGQERGWVQLLHGHLGNDGRSSQRPVAEHLARMLNGPVSFLPDWMDDCTGEVYASVSDAIRQLRPGAVVMLENARRYSLETSLWRPKPMALAPLLDRLTHYAQTVRQRIAKIHVNEAFAASNCDLSSALVPLAMDRVALGRHVARELSGPVRSARQAEVIVFSGAKFNKLDDLEGIVARGQVRLILAGGLLALPLLWAKAHLLGRSFEIGRAEEVPAERCEQSCRLLAEMQRRAIELLLPVDFVLEDGTLAEHIPRGAAQRDVGPRTLERFARHLAQYSIDRPGAVIFHNGVLGQFERPEFAVGTRRFIGTLKEMYQAGMRVYIGGGEGGTAFRQWGDPARVTHCFTAGTTILKALGVKPIPYIWALHTAANRTPVGGGNAI